MEAAFEGPAETVEGMLAWAREGPEWARVSSVEAADEPPAGDAGFEIRRH